MKIFVCIPLTAVQQRSLVHSLEGDDLYFAPEGSSGSEVKAAFNASEVVFGNPPADWLLEGIQPRWIQLESVGFGEYVNAGLASGPTLPMISNLSGFFSEPVAESMLAGILGFLRGLGPLQELQRRSEWIGDDLRPRLRVLKGLSVVMIGRGAINKRLAELLAPFDCRIASFGSDLELSDLDEALRNADIVACCVPHTERTKNLFGANRLALLKADALFLNFGRGSLVDENALADALIAHRLGGAVIDVTREEPIPNGHPFWATPRLMLTQHTAGGSIDELERKIEIFLDNLARYRQGKALLSPIDFRRGY
jgi:glyoxylate/hydroxypyruvate reductase A